MSVLIRGMQMPLTCLQCMESELRSTIKCAEWTKISAGVRQLQRAPSCPILEVPEKHGDLIDKDVLLDDLLIHADSYFADFARLWTNKQPTVIESEGTEE